MNGRLGISHCTGIDDLNGKNSFYFTCLAIIIHFKYFYM